MTVWDWLDMMTGPVFCPPGTIVLLVLGWGVYWVVQKVRQVFASVQDSVRGFGEAGPSSRPGEGSEEVRE